MIYDTKSSDPPRPLLDRSPGLMRDIRDAAVTLVMSFATSSQMIKIPTAVSFIFLVISLSPGAWREFPFLEDFHLSSQAGRRIVIIILMDFVRMKIFIKMILSQVPQLTFMARSQKQVGNLTR